jgi:hypothetical protein
MSTSFCTWMGDVDWWKVVEASPVVGTSALGVVVKLLHSGTERNTWLVLWGAVSSGSAVHVPEKSLGVNRAAFAFAVAPASPDPPLAVVPVVPLVPLDALVVVVDRSVVPGDAAAARFSGAAAVVGGGFVVVVAVVPPFEHAVASDTAAIAPTVTNPARGSRRICGPLSGSPTIAEPSVASVRT